MRSETLGNITTKIGSGSTPRGGKESYKNQGISFIRSMNVHDFQFSTDGLAYIDDEQAKKLQNVTVKPDDILFNITGDSINRTCVVPEKILPARVNQHVSIIRCKKGVSPHYVNYYLINLKPYLMQICGVGGTRNALTKEALEKLPIRIDEDQYQIAKVLSDLDAKIELNNKINAELEAMAKLIYDYWFVQFDFPYDFAQGKPDEAGKPYKSSGGKMVYNEELKREIPEGWEAKRLGDYASIKKGTLITEKTANSDGEVKVVSAGLDFSYFHDKSNYPENTITVSASGASAGFINFWREPIFACDCTTIRGFSDSDTIQILGFLKLRQEYIYQQARGSAQPHVYPKDIENLKIAVPPKDVVSLFGKVVLSGNEKISNNLKENKKLAKIRDWLLPMLMNGQVKVK